MINKVDLGPHVEVDVAQMVADATHARGGGEVLALSRPQRDFVDALCAWIRWLRQEHLAGRHTPQDPGAMAPHVH